ncbi:hypothetical protein R3W88_000611 [Solanum pinnatisectum]|uniref:DUF1985 domain-containing protein n=1 Tax=Solanum pinnatisectum TaxID=50273 RepID=A0AAV9MG24_9SOLN|nr:hypothetical protein R3W88_000611 [Solanum pinnatisectum]
MWVENKYKHLHDPLAMNDKSVVKPKQMSEKPPKKGEEKRHLSFPDPHFRRQVQFYVLFFEFAGYELCYKKILAHPLRFGAVFKFDFANEIKKSINEKGVEMFKNTIFVPYLNIPKCNFQDLLHVRHANGTVLQFSIKDFAIVIGLKCKGNVKDFSYSESTPGRLLQRYFPDATAGITKSHLIQRFQMGNWETTHDTVQMAILYFVHTFMLCQLGETSIQIEEFLMVEDGRYELYPWG